MDEYKEPQRMLERKIREEREPLWNKLQARLLADGVIRDPFDGLPESVKKNKELYQQLRGYDPRRYSSWTKTAASLITRKLRREPELENTCTELCHQFKKKEGRVDEASLLQLLKALNIDDGWRYTQTESKTIGSIDHVFQDDQANSIGVRHKKTPDQIWDLVNIGQDSSRLIVNFYIYEFADCDDVEHILEISRETSHQLIQGVKALLMTLFCDLVENVSTEDRDDVLRSILNETLTILNEKYRSQGIKDERQTWQEILSCWAIDSGPHSGKEEYWKAVAERLHEDAEGYKGVNFVF